MSFFFANKFNTPNSWQQHGEAVGTMMDKMTMIDLLTIKTVFAKDLSERRV